MALQRLFRIQYVSDIHLEHYNKVAFPLIVKPAARYLALAGDIGHPNTPVWNSFFQYVNDHWDRTFYVTGNHEYYDKILKRWKYHAPTTMAQRHQQIKESLKKYERVTLLDSEQPAVMLNKERVAIVGNTLWTHIHESKYGEAEYTMNDYKYICMEGTTPLKAEDVATFHAEQKQQLKEQIDFYTFQKIPVVVLTHHMPSFKCISPKYWNEPMNYCYASKCEDLMNPNVRLWIFGHTHHAANLRVKDTMTVVNARGYPNEHVPGFSTDAWFEFDPSVNPDPIASEDAGASVELAAAAAGVSAIVEQQEKTNVSVKTEIEDLEFV